jgi:XTP/dITP diphosphohydrolase
MDTNSQKEDAGSVRQLILATRNKHKTREFLELMGDDFGLIDVSRLPNVAMPDETGATFQENGILKAVAVSKLADDLVIADDSGLEVDALDGAPGICSARYAGELASDAANIEKLLRELTGVEDRSARFRCVIALASAGNVVGIFEGVAEGTIVDHSRGMAGFGYDPVFQPSGFNQTFGEIASGLKNRVSHRAKAVALLREKLHQIAVNVRRN